MSSVWRDRQIAVDGRDGDWQNTLTYVTQGNSVISLLNDGEFLYLRLASTDRQLQTQVMRFGFTVWFGTGGGKKKNLGIHFPLGTPGHEGAFPDGDEETDQFGRKMRTTREHSEHPPAIALGQVEIIGPGKGEHHQLKDADDEGVDIEVVQANDRLVYELKIPLVRDAQHPYAIGTQPGQQVQMGLETSIPNREAARSMRVPEGEAGPEGLLPEGMGGGKGGMRQRGTEGRWRRPSYGGGPPPQPMQLWATLTLAAASNPTEPKP